MPSTSIACGTLLVLIGFALSFSGGPAIDLGDGRFPRTTLSDFMASYLINFWFLLTIGLGVEETAVAASRAVER